MEQERERVRGEGGRRRLKEKKIDLGFFFSFYTRAGQVPAPKKIVYPKSNPYLQQKKT
jgi:hypothetical protein